jgi:hypothetical protein
MDSRWMFDVNTAFVFADRGAAEVIAATNGAEIEELPEPDREETDLSRLLNAMHAGDIRDRINILAFRLERQIINLDQMLGDAELGRTVWHAAKAERDALERTLQQLRDALR